MGTFAQAPPVATPTAPPLAPVDPAKIEVAARQLESASPEDVLRWTIKRFGLDVALSCSFGGPSGIVLVDMLARLGSLDKVEVYFIDTGLLFDETHALRAKVEQRYSFRAASYDPALDLSAQAAMHEDALWNRDPDTCCSIRRVAPNVEALRERRAWVAGLRRDQSTARANTPVVAWNARHEVIKVAPLATWTEEMVWDYVRRYDVPVNELHASGFPSVGCTVCTTRVDNGEHVRSGRWRGSDKTECGLHWQI